MAESSDPEGWTNLHHAVADRFTNLVYSLSEQGEDTNMVDGQGRTPLHLACSNIKGKLEPIEPISSNCESEDLSDKILTETELIVEYLLSHGADPTILDKAGKAPLHCLVDQWLEKRYPLERIGRIFTKFLHCGCNINVKDINGRTPLHYIAGSPDIQVPIVKRTNNTHCRLHRYPGNRYFFPANRAEENNLPKYTPEDLLYMKEFLIKLMSTRVDLNVRDFDGNTPLHLAITANKFDVVKELLMGNTNVNVQNSSGQTPLHIAVSDKEKFKHCGILLLYKGARASIQDVHGQTPVDIVRYRKDFPCFIKHLVLLMNVKMHPKMHINTRNSKSYRAIRRECQQECSDLNSYFDLRGRSQLPLLLRTHSLPSYTEHDFFLTNINSEEFADRFPNYSQFINYKFTQDRNRRKMIEKCTAVFSCFGGNFHYNKAGRLVYTRNSHWENLPEELKLLILSYLRNEDLELLEKHLSE